MERKGRQKRYGCSRKISKCQNTWSPAKQILTKAEKIMDNAIGFLTDAPFGIPEVLNSIKNTDKEFYLVNQSDKQFFVIVIDEFIESRQLAEKITDKKFSIGNFSFVDCGIISDFEGIKK